MEKFIFLFIIQSIKSFNTSDYKNSFYCNSDYYSNDEIRDEAIDKIKLHDVD
jgi:hypothetical protein